MWKTAVRTIAAGAALATMATAAPALATTTGTQISVNGSGQSPVPAGATYAQQQTSYDQALTAATSDASAKAQQIAQQLSLTLGPVVSFTEESFDYIGYCGVAFAPGVAAPVSSGVAAPSTSVGGSTAGGTQVTPIPKKSGGHKGRKKHSHRTAATARPAQASDQSCTVEADVTIVYSAS